VHFTAMVNFEHIELQNDILMAAVWCAMSRAQAQADRLQQEAAALGQVSKHALQDNDAGR
jgi:hypothetical protein